MVGARATTPKPLPLASLLYADVSATQNPLIIISSLCLPGKPTVKINPYSPRVPLSGQHSQSGDCPMVALGPSCPRLQLAASAYIMELYSSGWTAGLPFSTAAATQPLLWAPNRLFHNPQLPLPTTLQEQLKMQLPILGQSFHHDPSDLQFGRK